MLCWNLLDSCLDVNGLPLFCSDFGCSSLQHDDICMRSLRCAKVKKCESRFPMSWNNVESCLSSWSLAKLYCCCPTAWTVSPWQVHLKNLMTLVLALSLEMDSSHSLNASMWRTGCSTIALTIDVRWPMNSSGVIMKSPAASGFP